VDGAVVSGQEEIQGRLTCSECGAQWVVRSEHDSEMLAEWASRHAASHQVARTRAQIETLKDEHAQRLSDMDERDPYRRN
jgi:hypothetical protein